MILSGPTHEWGSVSMTLLVTSLVSTSFLLLEGQFKVLTSELFNIFKIVSIR